MNLSCVGQYGILLVIAITLAGAEFHVAGTVRNPGANSSGALLPGGRSLQPYGKELEAGPGTAALSISPKGLLATADIGPERYGVTLIEPPVKGIWHTQHIWARTPDSRAPEVADPDWKTVAAGLAFESERALWVSEGPSGRIRLIDPLTAGRRKLLRLDNRPSSPSHSGALAFDPVRRVLYALDTAANSLIVIDTRTARIRSTLALGREPADIALTERGQYGWITFAPAEARSGDIALIDLRDPAHPLLLDPVPSGGLPERLLAADGRVFASDPQGDSILVFASGTHQVTAHIPLRIQGLEEFRGISPAGLAYDPLTNWLLVAEPGINAVGVVDLAAGKLIGHIPTGWMPTDVAISTDRVYVANRNGHGTGPNVHLPLLELGEPPALHHGSVTTFIMPAASALAGLTATVLASNGFLPDANPAPPMPALAGHVVLITCEARSFDEVLGDVLQVGNTRVTGFPAFARFGLHGLASGAPGQFSLHDVSVTPNLHRIAQSGAFSENYYSEAEAPQTEHVLPLLDHLKRHGVEAAEYDSATGFLEDFQQRTRSGSTDFPAFVSIGLPRPTALSGRFPYEASFVADADLNIGRILEALSRSPWWRDMVVLVTASGAPTSLDHIDSHRTLLFAAGPQVKRTYLLKTNASFPAVVRAVLELLRIPPLGLRDAAAPSLREIFTGTRNNVVFTTLQPDPRLFASQ